MSSPLTMFSALRYRNTHRVKQRQHEPFGELSRNSGLSTSLHLSHGFHTLQSRGKQCSVHAGGFRWPLPGDGPTCNPERETLSAETDCKPLCGLWSPLSSKLTQHCISRGETTSSQRGMPLGWRLPGSDGCIKYSLICDIFTL